MTQEAVRVLDEADLVLFRTRIHPTVAELDLTAETRDFDALYDSAPSFDAVYETIVEEILKLLKDPRNVVYAVPGHPLIGEATVREALRRSGGSIRIVAGLSFIEPVLAEAGIDPLEQSTLISDALDPVVHPDTVGVYAQVYDRSIAGRLKLVLLRSYPPEHEVVVVRFGEAAPRRVPLEALDRSDEFDHLTVVVVPAPNIELAAGSFEAIYEVVRRLRAPDGCPWDREQTHASLTRYLVEECYEAIDALESGDQQKFAEELGDVLLQVLLHAQIADDNGDFDIHDVMAAITHKLIRRHPHVFGDASAADAAEVEVNWEALKRAERVTESSILEHVPVSMPGLAQVQGLQERAAKVGFDWPNREGVLAKLAEELLELEQAVTHADREHELGDVLMTLVNLARWDGIQAEEALRAAAARFRGRFSYIEDQARAGGLAIDSLGLDAMERLWNEAKLREKTAMTDD